MKIQALIDFDDHGRKRKAGETWKACCVECAMKLIKEGKVKKVR